MARLRVPDPAPWTLLLVSVPNLGTALAAN